MSLTPSTQTPDSVRLGRRAGRVAAVLSALLLLQACLTSHRHALDSGGRHGSPVSISRVALSGDLPVHSSFAPLVMSGSREDYSLWGGDFVASVESEELECLEEDSGDSHMLHEVALSPLGERPNLTSPRVFSLPHPAIHGLMSRRF